MLYTWLEYWLGPNWRTSINGLAAFIALIVSEVAVEYDTAYLRISARIIAALGILNGFRMTRDKKVSDEESGIPSYRTGAAGLASYQRKMGIDDNNPNSGMA